MVVPLVTYEDWEDCATCAMHPFGTMTDGTKCGISKEPANYPGSGMIVVPGFYE